jgi:hypothetical protein
VEPPHAWYDAGGRHDALRHREHHRVTARYAQLPRKLRAQHDAVVTVHERVEIAGHHSIRYR